MLVSTQCWVNNEVCIIYVIETTYKTILEFVVSAKPICNQPRILSLPIIGLPLSTGSSARSWTWKTRKLEPQVTRIGICLINFITCISELWNKHLKPHKEWVSWNIYKAKEKSWDTLDHNCYWFEIMELLVTW